MEIFPLTNTTEPLGSCVIPEGNSTVSDVPASPAYIRKLIHERALQELEDMRPRISAHVVSDDQRQTEPATLASVIPAMPNTRSVSIPDGYTFAVVDKGRVALRDSVKLLGWNNSTPLSFTVTSSGATVTACVGSEENVTMMDKQHRCAVPLQVCRRTGMENGETVLVITSRTPVAHVRIVTALELFDALDMKENER